MWLKNGMKRFFEIALVTLFLFFLLGNLPYAQAQEHEFHWGLENCTIGACPEGLAGPFFFQYRNKWASYKEVKFEGWESEEKLGQAWCFLGSIATIILYHEYPIESHFDGFWFSGKNVRIDHVWKYADIKDLSGVGGIDGWYQDNPETRDITGCKIAGYCRAADEIRRLFGAITAALGFSSKYAPIFEYPYECISDMMRNYFGYQSELIEPINGRLGEENKQKLIESLNAGYPVIVVGDGHAWVLDGYQDDNGDEFHILNFGCGDSHKSYWITDPVSDGGHYSAKAFIINLRPMDATLTKNSIAYDTHNNRYLLVYQFDQYIYGQLKNFDGTPFGDKFVISDSDAIDDRRYPSVAYDSANQKFLVVWTDLRNRETTITDIYGQIVNADGTRNNDNFIVSKAVNFQDRPSVAYDSANQRFLVVWQDSRDMESTRSDIYGQIVDAEGNPYGANFVLSNADGGQGFPSVAYDSANQRFLVVWSDYRNWKTAGYDIYGQIVKADGNPYCDELIISNHVKSQVSPSVTYDIQNQRFLVVWSDGRGGESTTYDIYGRILDTVGNFYTDDFVISKAVNFQSTPSAAYDSANQKFLVVWSDYRNVKYSELEYREIPNSDIYGQIVQGNGNLYGGNLAISDADGGQRSPSVAYNSNIENFLVAFNTYKTDKPAENDLVIFKAMEIVNDLVDFTPMRPYATIPFTEDYPPSKCGCRDSDDALFYFIARLKNTSNNSLANLTVRVNTLTNNNLLILGTNHLPQTAFIGAETGGVETLWTLPETSGYYVDGVLAPGEITNPLFGICLDKDKIEPFDFWVDLLGTVR